MFATTQDSIRRRVVDGNVWLNSGTAEAPINLPVRQLEYQVLESEEAVGRAQFNEIVQAARLKEAPLVIVLLGGRGAQALHRLLGQVAQTDEFDGLLGRLQVFTQDALAPMRLDNGFSFVRDFERLLGKEFFAKIKSFTCMRTDSDDLESELARYIEKLQSLGGIDIFFLGMGPEPEGASHLAYIKKFKAGGSTVNKSDEGECRAATHILTLGPAAILGAKRLVQSIVDASTAPGKRESYARLLTTEISDDPEKRLAQLNENPGLWIRLHPNVKSLILGDVLEA